MKKIAILVIAATNQPVYEYYIRNYWTDLIDYTKSQTSHIDVFLLFENKFDTSDFGKIQGNIIRDDETALDSLCERKFHSPQVPGILSKTLFALEQLQDYYDVFFRTNLSSIVRLSRFNSFVQRRKSICYSGAFVWDNALRDELSNHNAIGPGKSIASLAELEKYPGNTFISGSGFFLNQQEAKFIVQNKHNIQYAIPDDVSIGLMLPKHEILPGFTLIIRPNNPVDEMNQMVASSAGCHIRLQHFPLGVTQKFWDQFKATELWC
ncbi:MAG: hypothetical protein ACI8P9_002000 [Parasphingorhabdus sp.]|jgi:hypothetical protein